MSETDDWPNPLASDSLLDLARTAEVVLNASSLDDLEGINAALVRTLEAARLFRAQIDLGNAVATAHLRAFETLFQATVALQPPLSDLETQRKLESLETKMPPTPHDRQIGEVQAYTFSVARIVLETLQIAYNTALRHEPSIGEKGRHS